MDTEGPSTVGHHLEDDKPSQVLIQQTVKSIHQSANQYAMPNQINHQHNHTSQMYQPHQPRPHQLSTNDNKNQFVLPNIQLDLDSINTSSALKTQPSNSTKSSNSHIVQNNYLLHTNPLPRSKPLQNSGKTTRTSQSPMPTKEQHSFNPFADENDRSANHFQLSKTSAGNPTQTKIHNNNGRPLESSPFSRVFGFNRTNLMWSTTNPGSGGLKVEAQPSGTLASHLHTSPNVSRFQIRSSLSTNRSPTAGDSSRLQAFRPLLPVDTTGGRPGGGKSGSPYRASANRPDQMQFKCFDLIDEAGWLNFE